MQIDCPHCGSRDSGEFIFRGDAAPKRPDTLDTDDFVEYVYQRDNPAGWLTEHWYHLRGCRQWLVVRRNTVTHAIDTVTLAAEPAL